MGWPHHGSHAPRKEPGAGSQGPAAALAFYPASIEWGGPFEPLDKKKQRSWHKLQVCLDGDSWVRMSVGHPYVSWDVVLSNVNLGGFSCL